jgi:hypothetical protein
VGAAAVLDAFDVYEFGDGTAAFVMPCLVNRGIGWRYEVIPGICEAHFVGGRSLLERRAIYE